MANIKQSPFEAMALTDREITNSIINSRFICDYGVITSISQDKKKVNVKHAVIATLRTGEELDAYETNDVEVLYPSSSGLTIQYDLAVDDPVLLIGLKDYVKDTTNITVESQKTYVHYDQATLKAIPLAGANTAAKVLVKSDNGKLTVDADSTIELNGNSKQFVTWSELNTALQGLITALGSHVHTGVTTGPGSTGTPASVFTLDISSAKTTTIKTGG